MQKPEVIDKLVEAYRMFARYPSIVSGQILKSDSNNTIRIKSKWSQRNLEKKELTQFQKFHLLSSTCKDFINLPPIDVSTEQFSSLSASERYSCVIRDGGYIKESTSKKKQFLEIWQNDSLYRNFDVDEIDVHGSIYYDGEFGSLEWSPDETKILYIAEKKALKAKPFYNQKPKDSKDKSDEILVGQEYNYKPDWGEQLVDKHQPVIGICDLKSETLKVVEGVPPNFSPGQVIWTSDGQGIYGVVLNNEPRRLGLVYCSNREGYIFHLSLKGEFKILSEKNKSVRSPRLSSDGKYLYWLQRSAVGPHHACQELIRYDLATNKREVIVPVIRQPSEFSGIYSFVLPRRCFSNDGRRLYFTTVNKTKTLSYYVDLDTKEVNLVKTDGSSSVLDVHNDNILIATSSLQSSSALKLSRSIENIEWIPVTKSESILKGSVVKHLEFDLKATKDDFTYFSALYFGPEPPTGKTIPLIVYPHGGPHSCSTDIFNMECAFFVSLGFAVLFVNYRGSTGAGEDGVQFLPGRISDTDVKDNQHAVNHVLKEFPYVDEKKLLLFGGSHGGFLVTQLSAQYPDTYKAVVARNPVIDVFSMYSATDISDWNATESGFPFDESVPLTTDQANKMLKVSPIYQAQRIKAPTYLMIGKKDLRVPFSQGLYMYNLLKARNVKTKLNLYDDNHPLGQVPVHIDSLINSTLWFMEHLENAS